MGAVETVANRKHDNQGVATEHEASEEAEGEGGTPGGRHQNMEVSKFHHLYSSMLRLTDFD